MVFICLDLFRGLTAETQHWGAVLDWGSGFLELPLDSFWYSLEDILFIS